LKALESLPIVADLKKKNKRLRRENKALRNLIYSLPEFRCQCVPHSHPDVEYVDRNIKFKTEPGLEPTPCDTLVDDEVVVIEKPVQQNIVYTIESDAEVDESEEEEEVDGSEAEEAEVDGSEEAEEAEEEEAEEAEEEEEVEEEEAEVDGSEEAEDEVSEVTISGKSYYTTNTTNGIIYSIDANEEVGDEVGVFKDGKPKFHKK
jgi:hypothetical protein